MPRLAKPPAPAALAVLAAGALVSAACGPTKQATGTGAGGNACTNEPDQATCLKCAEEAYPHGATLLNDLVNCLFCTACYTVCESEAHGACGDAGRPPSTDPCDRGTPGTPGTAGCGNANSGCVLCAQGSGHTCEQQRNACNDDQDCLKFNAAILQCPAN